MVVTFRFTNPYIASRNGGSISETVVFEGTKRECENYLFNEFCDCFQNDVFVSTLAGALRWSRKSGRFDGLYRSLSGRLYMDWDSRVWEVKFKKEVGA